MLDPLVHFHAPTQRWFRATFDAPTEVQRRGWPAIQDGKHTLMFAPTGSGKTLAAFLAALDQLTALPRDAQPGVRVLYISPLKALVYDIERNLRAPLIGMEAATEGAPWRPIRVDIRTGDTSQTLRRSQQKDPAEVLVTTPESLFLLLGSQARENLRTVHTIIVDEIHVLAGSKRGTHLALSLERLCVLTACEPQRIGLSATQRPLETIAAFLGGDREVRIIDTSEPPHLKLEIVVPVADMDHPPKVMTKMSGGEGQLQRVGGATKDVLASGLWPSIYPEILTLIRAHRSTIVFTNSRLLCERLAQRLNELAGEDLVRAHHGSIAHSQRHHTEELLKSGQLPAIVATSSLELGIDMGAVDLVVLVESPGAVSRGLQRIGRAGHGVGEISTGRIFPKHKADLLECVVVAARMEAGMIEATTVPENCLDVLAQQIIAMCAMDLWTRPELLATVRRAHPYRRLTDPLADSVLSMLAGLFPSDAFAEFSARISWDRATDTLRGRKGSKTLSRMNAGTIPDRGLYGVFLADEDGPRLGELDEEMVFESRAGDVILLGATSWRIQQITRDRVLVRPAPGEPGRLPFWHGDRPGRPADLGRALGAFVEHIGTMDPVKGMAELQNRGLDKNAANNVITFLSAQRALTEVLPSHKTLVIERFRDPLGDWRVCILSPFGRRVHAPWAMAIEAVLGRSAGFEIQTLWTDDGISVRFAGVDELPDLSVLFIEPGEIHPLVVDQLSRSALFAGRFRESAARALLLPRRTFQGRKPLWQQRLKSQRLQAAASSYPGFPILLETYRECLADVFDLPALTEILGAVHRGEIAIVEVETARPSPFARSLVYAYAASSMYDGDVPLAERRAQALTLDRGLLRELLGEEPLRELLVPHAIAEVEAALQWLGEDRSAAHPDAVADLLRRLGDLSIDELAARCAQAPLPWLTTLAQQQRALPIHLAGQARWIAAEDAGRYRDAFDLPLPEGLPDDFLAPYSDAIRSIFRRYAATHGPFQSEDLATRYALPVGAVEGLLQSIPALIHGGLRPGSTTTEWCDPQVMGRLRRRSLAALRKEVAPVEGEVYARFLHRWHGIGDLRSAHEGLLQVIDRLEGVPIPFSDLEAWILPARMKNYQPVLLDQLCMTGELAWRGVGAIGKKDGRIVLIRREREHLLRRTEPPEDLFTDPDQGSIRATIWAHLQQRGACFLTQLHLASDGVSVVAVQRALWDLVWAGLVTNDTFLPLRSLRSPARRGSSRRPAAGGRWSAVPNVAPSPTEEAVAAADRLLKRHGIVASATARSEALEGGFSRVYPVYRAMEEAGKARRGWFVDGIGGAQFATTGAVDLLRRCRERTNGATVLIATDPANPYGATLPWPVRPDPQPRRDPGALVVLVDGQPVLFLGRGGKRLLSFTDHTDRIHSAAQALFESPARVHVTHIDGDAALRSPLGDILCHAGFSPDYRSINR